MVTDEERSEGGTEMRRGWAIAAAILVVLLTVGIAVGAYNAGLDEGVRRAADSSQVVTVVGDRYGHGFFPFGFFLFPLLIIGTFLLIGRAFRGPRGHWGHDHGPAYGPSEQGRARFEDKASDWHRRQHEQGSGGEETTGPPAG
jgi:hypothetical protein